jgi:universal stress protein E
VRKLSSISVAVGDLAAKQQPAVRKAAAIASACGARITLVNTFMLPQPMPELAASSSKQLLAATARQRQQQLQRMAVPLRRQGLRVHCEVHWDFPPHVALVRHVLRAKPDLLIAASHRHNRFSRLLLANTDWELIRHCPCPLWLVRSKTLRKHPRLLVAVDPLHSHAKPAQLDDNLLQTARVVARKTGGRVAIAHACAPPVKVVAQPFAEAVIVPVSAEEHRRHLARLQALTAKLARKYRVAPRDRHLQAGGARQVLQRLCASLQIDVLVMGAISRSALDRFFIGSTAESVIDTVSCDVLIGKPSGFHSNVSKAAPKLPTR